MAVPIIYKDSLVDVVKEQINATINAKADFADVDISLFSSFPHFSLALNEFSVVGIDQFEDVPLVKAKKAGVTLDLWSLMSSNVDIRSVELNEPLVNVLVLENGQANYDIAKADTTAVAVDTTTTTTATDFNIALQKYSIDNALIRYDDRSADIFLEIEGLDHSGKGDFTLSVYDLDTETNIEKMTVRQAGVSYLKNAELNLDAIFHIDTENSIYGLKENKLRVNALELLADGQLQMKEEDMILDFTFGAPSTDFRALWSLIPSAYTADFSNVDISGQFRLDGLVKGTYNESTYPAFRLQTKVDNGNVKYPDLPVAVKSINAFLDINSPTSDLDDMVVNMSKLALNVGGDPFSANMKVSTPISDPNVDAKVEGKIDLDKWSKAFPMEGIDELAGVINANVSMNTRMSTIEKEAYDQVNMSGDIAMDNFKYASADMPAVAINKVVAAFSPEYVQLDEFDAHFGKSDLKASGRIDNILAYISPQKTMKGSFTAHTDYFYIDEWMTEETTTEAAPAPVPTAEPSAETEEAVFDRFDFAMDATANKIVYDTYTLTNAALKGRVRPNLIEVDNIQTNIGESDFRGNGTIKNGFDYAFNDGVLGGDLRLKSSFLDLNPFMEEPEGAPAPAAEQAPAEEVSYGVIPIPANIDMKISGDFAKIRYTDMDLNNVKARMAIADEAVVIEEGRANTLGGAIGFTGLYETKDVAKPAYNFKFNLDNMDFKKSFNTFNTFQSFAPIGKLINGNFSTELIMSGELGEDMMPDLKSVNAEGLFETLQGSVSSLTPLVAIGNALDVDEFKESIQLNNLKTWFTIEDGKFNIKPFDAEIAGLPMKIGGSHSLDQEMDYTINTVIPRSMLGNGALGSTVNQGLSALVGQANKLGLNVNNAENLNVQISLKGLMEDPKVGFKLLGANGESSVADAAKEEVKDLVKDQVDDVKDQVTETINDTKEELTNQATEFVDSMKNATADEIKDAGKDLINDLGGNAGSLLDSVGIGNGTDLDSIKNHILDFNPFKKKKKKKNGGK